MAAGNGPAYAPPGAPAELLEFIWRVWALGVVGPLRVAHASQHEVVIPDGEAQLAHINTSGKPQFVEIRVINGLPAPVFFISGSQSANVEQSQPWNAGALDVYRAITYPSDRLFIRQKVAIPTRVLVSEVSL